MINPARSQPSLRLPEHRKRESGQQRQPFIAPGPLQKSCKPKEPTPHRVRSVRRRRTPRDLYTARLVPRQSRPPRTVRRLCLRLYRQRRLSRQLRGPASIHVRARQPPLPSRVLFSRPPFFKDRRRASPRRARGRRRRRAHPRLRPVARRLCREFCSRGRTHDKLLPTPEPRHKRAPP